MKLLVQTSKSFLSGGDLNRLETSFVKTSIKDSFNFISFFFTRSLEHLDIVAQISEVNFVQRTGMSFNGRTDRSLNVTTALNIFM